MPLARSPLLASRPDASRARRRTRWPARARFRAHRSRVHRSGGLPQSTQLRHALAPAAGPCVDGPALAGEQRRCPAFAHQLQLVAARREQIQRRHPQDHVADPVAQPHDQWPWLHSGADNRHPSILPPDPMAPALPNADEVTALHDRLLRTAALAGDRTGPARRGPVAVDPDQPPLQQPAVGRRRPGAPHPGGRRPDRRQQTRDRPLQPGAQRCHRARRRDCCWSRWAWSILHRRAAMRRVSTGACRGAAEQRDRGQHDRPPVDHGAEGACDAAADRAHRCRRGAPRVQPRQAGAAAAAARRPRRLPRRAARRCAAGRAYFKVYRQFKMYNDPRFNPALVSERQGRG